jgi:hypothetical protein
MPSLFTAVISEIEGGDTFADAALKSYPLLLVRAAEGVLGGSRASTTDRRLDRRRWL